MEYIITALGGVRPYFEVFKASNSETAIEYFINSIIDTVGSNEVAESTVENGCLMLTVHNEGGKFYFILTKTIDKNEVEWMNQRIWHRL